MAIAQYLTLKGISFSGFGEIKLGGKEICFVFCLLSFVESHTCSSSLFILCMCSYYVIIFLRHLYNFYQAAVAIK